MATTGAGHAPSIGNPCVLYLVIRTRRAVQRPTEWFDCMPGGKFPTQCRPPACSAIQITNPTTRPPRPPFGWLPPGHGRPTTSAPTAIGCRCPVHRLFITTCRHRQSPETVTIPRQYRPSRPRRSWLARQLLRTPKRLPGPIAGVTGDGEKRNRPSSRRKNRQRYLSLLTPWTMAWVLDKTAPRQSGRCHPGK